MPACTTVPRFLDFSRHQACHPLSKPESLAVISQFGINRDIVRWRTLLKYQGVGESRGICAKYARTQTAVITGDPSVKLDLRLESNMNTSPVPNEIPSLPSNLPASLDDILITDRLSARPQRLPRAASENKALRALATVMANSPEELPDTLLQTALELCNAGTAGLSLLETTPTGEVIFRWTNLAGALKGHVGGFTPREFSPSGATLDRKS